MQYFWMRTLSFGQGLCCRWSCSVGRPASSALHTTFRLSAPVHFCIPWNQDVFYSRCGKSAGFQLPCILSDLQRSEGLGGASFLIAATLTPSVWLSPREELAPVQMHKECSSHCSALGLITFLKDLPAPGSPRVRFIEATGEQVQDGHCLPSVDVCSDRKHRKRGMITVR